MNLPLRIVAAEVGVVSIRGRVPSWASVRIVVATSEAPKNMKKTIMPARTRPTIGTSSLSPPVVRGARLVNVSASPAPPPWTNAAAAACAAAEPAFGPAVAAAPAAAARAPLKSSSACPTMDSVMAVPNCCVGFTYSSTADRASPDP